MTLYPCDLAETVEKEDCLPPDEIANPLGYRPGAQVTALSFERGGCRRM